MDREAARAGLSSAATEERLRASRWFQANATSKDADVLRQALLTERVPWIRRALDHAVSRSEKRRRSAPSAETLSGTGEATSEDLITAGEVLGKAREQVTEQLVHEISPMVGALKSAVSREWDGFEGSDTERIIDQTVRLIESLRALNLASVAPKFESVPLSVVIQELVASVAIPEEFRVLLEGPAHLSVEADRGKLEIAVSNGLRNAVEALESFSSSRPPTITVTWGVTADEVWVVLKDTGPGFPGNDPSSYKRRGATGKDGHLGHGLALASAAMEAMGGEVIVKNAAPGAHLELRWFRRNANSGS